MNQLHPPNPVPPGVEIAWSNEDPADPERYITGANFHTAHLRLNQHVDLSPHPPLDATEAEQVFLQSLGMTGKERTTYLDIIQWTTKDRNRRALKKLGATSYHAVRRLFGTGVVEVVKPIALPKPPDDETCGLANILCNYPTLREAHKQEKGDIKGLLGRTAAHYGLRGIYDFMTWTYATKLLKSSPPTGFVEPIKDKPKPVPFAWHQTANGFTVSVFDKTKSCAELEFEGSHPRTAWLRAITAAGGRIAVRNFFDTPSSRIHLSQDELGALAITSLGGTISDIERLSISNPKAALHSLREKLDIPRIRPPYIVTKTTASSFNQKVMTCETPPAIMTMTDVESHRVRLLAHFDSHTHAEKTLYLKAGSMKTLLSRIAARSSFPTIAGVHFMLYAANEYANPGKS